MNGPILVISGTNRPGANALKIANLLLAHYKSTDLHAELYSLADLPTEIFAPSSYATKPQAFQVIQDQVVAARGLHVVTPEYNGSFPGVLKYFIDMLTFPERFEHKPVAYVGESAGGRGGLRAVEQVQAVFGYGHADEYPVRVLSADVHQAVAAGGSW